MNWDNFFEGDLIPLIGTAKTPEAVHAAIDVVINALFQRSGDVDNRKRFRRLYYKNVDVSAPLEVQIDRTLIFLRMVKEVRKELAVRPARPEGSNIPSSDLARLDPAEAAAPPEPPPPPSEPELTGFDAVFDATLTRRLAEILAALHTGDPGSLRLPFALARPFAEALDHAARTWLLEPIRTSRAVTSRLRDLRPWTSADAPLLLQGLTEAESSTPIPAAWESCWRILATEPAKGGAMWRFFADHAQAHHYLPCTPDDLPALIGLLRADPARLHRAWAELNDLYEQEFEPRPYQQQAREGALRDGMVKWTRQIGIPPHCGEWFAIRGIVDWKHLDATWLRNWSRGWGRTEEMRRVAIPYVMKVLDQCAV